MKCKTKPHCMKLKFDYVSKHVSSIKRHFLPFLYVFILSFGCTQQEKHDAQSVNEVQILPAPNKLLYKRGSFVLSSKTRILLNLSDNREKEVANYLLQRLKQKIKHKLKIADRFTTSKIKNKIELVHQPQLAEDGYNLYVSSTTVRIEFSNKRSATYAIETFFGILENENGKWLIPQLSIEDKPYMTFRGIYLKAETKLDETLINQLIRYRFNLLIIDDSIKDPIDSQQISIINKHDADSLALNYLTNLSPTNFYGKSFDTNDKLVYEINNRKLLSKDSLSIISEAMWTKPEVRNIQKLKEHLTVHKPETN